jgi:tRNA A-37 threonylcarbamoyl transferase component Bud32
VYPGRLPVDYGSAGAVTGEGHVQQLGSRYSLDQLIGRGGTGEVWCGRDEADRRVAVKVLRRELVDDSDIVTRFVRERRLLESVRDPHVVEVLDLVAEGDTLAIVMEYVPRSDLRTHVHELGGALAPALAVDVARQILEALAAVHAAGVVHRDVKPENVLVAEVDDAGQLSVKLSDFGVSRLIDGRTLSRATGLIGTPRYMAPELGDGADPSPASDIYAVGVMLYELLTGRVPFVGEHAIAILQAHSEQKPQRPAGVSNELWKVLSSLLAKSPQKRPADAATAARRLAEIEPGLAGAPVLPAASMNREITVTPGRERTYVEELHTPRTVSGRVWGQVRAHSRASVALTTAVACFAGLAFMVGPGVIGSSTPATVERAWLDTYRDFVVRRDWKLTGAKGDKFQATEAIIVTSPKKLGAGSRYLQVVPKELADHDWKVRFVESTPLVAQADPVFNIPLAGATQGTYTFVSYSIDVAPNGRDANRLKDWNTALAKAREGLRDANPGKDIQVPTVTQVEPQASLTDASPIAPLQVLEALKAAHAPATPPGPLLLINNATPLTPIPPGSKQAPVDPVSVNPPSYSGETPPTPTTATTTTTTPTTTTTTTTPAPTALPPDTTTTTSTTTTSTTVDPGTTTTSSTVPPDPTATTMSGASVPPGSTTPST